MAQASHPLTGNCAAAVSHRLQPLINCISPTVHHYHGILIASSILGLTTVPWLVRNYKEYLALGPGGLPYDVRGWGMALFFRLFSRDTLGTAVYDTNPNKESWIEEPDNIPERRGTRPTSGFHILPARQFNKVPGEDILQVSTDS